MRGRNIQRYRAQWTGLWLIDTHNGYGIVPAIDINKYPTIKQHLDKFCSQLKTRQDQGITPYNLRSCAYYEEFMRDKIVWQIVTKVPMFCLVETNRFVLNSAAFLLKDEYPTCWIAILNSRLIKWIAETFVQKLGDTGYSLSNQYVEQLPIPEIPKTKQQLFVDLIDKILVAKETDPLVDISEWEKEIDYLVYNIYDLTQKEIRLIENFSLI